MGVRRHPRRGLSRQLSRATRLCAIHLPVQRQSRTSDLQPSGWIPVYRRPGISRTLEVSNRVDPRSLGRCRVLGVGSNDAGGRHLASGLGSSDRCGRPADASAGASTDFSRLDSRWWRLASGDRSTTPRTHRHHPSFPDGDQSAGLPHADGHRFDDILPVEHRRPLLRRCGRLDYDEWKHIQGDRGM